MFAALPVCAAGFVQQVHDKTPSCSPPPALLAGWATSLPETQDPDTF